MSALHEFMSTKPAPPSWWTGPLALTFWIIFWMSLIGGWIFYWLVIL